MSSQTLESLEDWAVPETAYGRLPSVLIVNRVVVGGILVSLLWKFKFFLVAVAIYERLPLKDDFFPTALQSSVVFFGCYIASILSSALAIVVRQGRDACLAAVVLSISLFILCIHQQTYNDVTFLTCWWTAIWSLWFTSRIGKDSEKFLLEKGAFLSHFILSAIFFGGAVGKLTPGYWSGQVLYEIYFVDRDYWFFNELRRIYGQEQLREIAVWYSRFVICAEFSCSILWLLPKRVASLWSILTCCGICFLSNVLLFSVLACMIALSIVGLHKSRSAETS